MIPDFKGHHFVEDFKPDEPPVEHHCERCGMKAELEPDGSIYFYVGPATRVVIDGAFPRSAFIPVCSGSSRKLRD
jgi:hypothetical protein